MNQRTSMKSSYSSWIPRTIRAQLLLSVDLVLAVLLVGALTLDYQHEMTQRLNQRREALHEEADSILQGCRMIYHHGLDATQRFIDDVCATSHDTQSPGHHVVLEIAGRTLQARSHGRQSTEMLQRFRDVLERGGDGDHSDSMIVIGTAGGPNMRVHVAETVSDIQASIQGETLTRTGTLLLLALIAAVVVNVSIGHFVTRPIHRLVTVVQRIGDGEVGIQSKTFHSAELNYLVEEINQMSLNLERADRDRRIQMEKAASIQRQLLPSNVNVPLADHASLFNPTDEVGGDYYDILPLADGSWLFCMADVSGHGVPAAMTAAIVKSLLAHESRRWSEPSEIIDKINRGLLELNSGGNFVTMALARYIPDQAILEFASAGHEASFLRRTSGDILELESSGLIVGLFEEAHWETRRISLDGSEILLLYTDGVTETFDSDHRQFGRDRVRAIMEGLNHSTSPDVVLRELSDAVEQFRGVERQRDDVTVLAVKFQATQNERLTTNV